MTDGWVVLTDSWGQILLGFVFQTLFSPAQPSAGAQCVCTRLGPLECQHGGAPPPQSTAEIKPQQLQDRRRGQREAGGWFKVQRELIPQQKHFHLSPKALSRSNKTFFFGAPPCFDLLFYFLHLKQMLNQVESEDLCRMWFSAHRLQRSRKWTVHRWVRAWGGACVWWRACKALGLVLHGRINKLRECLSTEAGHVVYCLVTSSKHQLIVSERPKITDSVSCYCQFISEELWIFRKKNENWICSKFFSLELFCFCSSTESEKKVLLKKRKELKFTGS